MKTPTELEVIKRELLLKRLQEKAKPKTQHSQQKSYKAIPHTDRTARIPASLAQTRLWFLDQLDGANSAYHISAAVRLTGTLHREALQETLNQLVERHEVLRTRFSLSDDFLCQIIDPPYPFALQEIDLRQKKCSENEFSRRIQEEINTLGISFDLEKGSLICGYLLRLEQDEHVLLLAMHHIVSDGWSMGVLIREVATLYAAITQSKPVMLNNLSIQYADYAVWQREWLLGERLTIQLDYWKQALDNAPVLLELPLDYPRPSISSYHGSKHDLVIKAELTARLRAVAQEHNVTLFMVLLTGWAIVLSKLAGQEDIVIGSPIAGRSHPQLEGLIGFFVNTLALRVKFDGNPTVVELLQRVREMTLGAYAHQDVPFDQVVEAVKPPRSLSHSPLFQTMFSLQNLPSAELTLPEISLAHFELEQTTSQFDITLMLQETADGLSGSITYAKHLFADETIYRIADYLQTILTVMTEHKERRLSQLSLLSTPARRQVIIDFNQTSENYSQDDWVHENVEKQTACTPDAIAVIGENRQLTYAELNIKANQLAHRLIEEGVRSDSLVVVFMDRSPELIISLLGILKAGAAYVPLDPSSPPERLKYILEDACPSVIITSPHLIDRLPAACSMIELDAGWSGMVAYSQTNPERHRQNLLPAHLAYVIYTSGSTGRPKGVMVEHRNLNSHICWSRSAYKIEPKDRVLQFASIVFDAASEQIWSALTQGACLVLRSDHAIGGFGQFTEWLLQQRITVANLPSAFWHSWCEAFDDSWNALPDLRCVIVGGEAMHEKALTLWQQYFGDSKRLINAYGPTEATITATTWEVSEREEGNNRTILIGRPVTNTQIYILDAYGEPVPVGVHGEIYIGGAQIARGYLNRVELTKTHFVPDTFSKLPGARLYKTGDLGRWLADGNIAYLGRNDFQVKIRGFRIELGEIESVLRKHATVSETLVLAREDVPGNKRLVAYVIPTGEAGNIDIEALKMHAQACLPDYMVPSAFVALSVFPLTTTGKVDRNALPMPDHAAGNANSYEAPQGALEIKLADIWREVLHVDVVGRYDNFFDLGGHSLLVIQMIERMRREGMKVNIRDLFIRPSIAALSTLIDREQHTAFTVPQNRIAQNVTAITPEMLPLAAVTQQEIDVIVAAIPGGVTNVQDIYPLAPLQQGILFHHLLNPVGDAYVLPILLQVDSTMLMEDLLRALQQVVNRHDILRSAVFWEGLSQPMQVVARHVELDVVDITAADPLAALQALMEPQGMHIDVAKPPLIKIFRSQDSRGKWYVLILQHHLIGDHVSLEIVLSEVKALLSGMADVDMPIPVPFRNFVAQMQEEHRPEEADAFFKAMLGDIVEPTAPFDLYDVNTNANQIATAYLAVDEELSARVRGMARRHGVSTAAMFHLAWALVVARTSDRDDVVFGTVLSGRMGGGTDVHRTPGVFINTLPIRVNISTRTINELVFDVQHSLGSLLRYEQASLALAQQCSGVANGAPLFTSLLNYRHSNLSADTENYSGVHILEGRELTTYPLVLSIDDQKTDFSLKIQCDRKISPETVLAMMCHALQQLVTNLEMQPDCLGHNIDVLPKEEMLRVVEAFNDTKTDYPKDIRVHELFALQAERTPNAIAVTHDGEQLSYAQLDAKADQLAHYLTGIAGELGNYVAIMLPRSIELIVAQLAVLKCGAAYVPINPDFPVQRQQFMIADCASRVVLFDKSISVIENIPEARLIDIQTAFAAMVDCDCINPPATSTATVAYVMYTSGSTGQPKGVMVPHRAINRLVINNGYTDISSRDCVAHCSNPAFDASTFEVWLPLLNGARLLIVSQETVLDSIALAHELQSHNVTVLWLTVGLFNQYADALAPVFGRLRYLLVGGDVLDPAVIARVLQNSPPEHLLNGYGPTETVTFATTYRVQDVPTGTYHVPIGRPIANTRVYILDRYGIPVPVGARGEIYIGGDGVACGYLNSPELTAKRFIPDVFSKNREARLYKTGDMGRWLSDGNIEYLGRNDFQIKVRGFRIELGEIEAALVKHPAVQAGIINVLEDVRGDKQLIAYIIPAIDAEVMVNDLRSHLQLTLPEYMIPTAFVTLDAFPLTPNGKVDRKILPLPEAKDLSHACYEAPQNATETALAEIWKAVLRIETVGRHDNFFALGGHSLLATLIISRVRQQFKADVSLKALFTHPTLKDFAQSIAQSMDATFSVIEPVDRHYPITASLPQTRLWFLDRLEGEGGAYNISVAVKLRGQLNVAALEGALSGVIARHESLRTTFALVDDIPLQVIRQPHPLILEKIDLTIDEVSGYAHAEAARSFNLVDGPLIRGSLIRLHKEDNEEFILLLTMHHIISDGWSMTILIREVTALYGSLVHTSPSELPPLPIQYADYATWQRTWLSGEILQKQLDYWKQQLSGVPALLDLPLDYPRPSMVSYSGANHSIVFSEALTERLQWLAQTHHATLFMVLLSGWAITLSKLSGQDDIVIGSPIAGRSRPEVEGLIGFFVNTLALRVSLDGDPSVAQLIDQVREMTLDAYTHQDVPFDQVVEAVQPPRSLSHSPLFQTMFVLQNTPTAVLSLPGISFEPFDIESGTAQFELTLTLAEVGSRLIGSLNYASHLFEAGTIARLAGYLEMTLSSMVDSAIRKISELSFISASERYQLVVGFNETKIHYSQDLLTHQLFARQAELSPEAIAVVYQEQRLTYAELNAKANSLTHELIKHGVEPDTLVALCSDRSLDMIVGLIGILKAGGAYLPLDPSNSTERLAFMIEDAAPVIVVTQQHLSEKFAGNALPVVLLDTDEYATGKDHQINPIHHDHTPHVTGTHLAYVIYTSGSTGKPKGVMVEHGNLLNLVLTQAAILQSKACKRVLQFANLSFDMSVEEIFPTLISGGELILRPASLLTPDSAFLHLIEKHSIHALNLPTAFWHEWVALLEKGLSHIPDSLRLLSVGGEKIQELRFRQWMLQEKAQHIYWFNAYGPTEATVNATHFSSDCAWNGINLPIGRPITNTQIYILDSYGNLAPIGVCGEIHIGGTQVARGYLRRPELTKERFIPDPFSTTPDAKLYKTGDLGRWLSDGHIEYLGRNDFQVKLRGFRIELGEVETALMRCENIQEALVIAREDIPGDKRLVAYLVSVDAETIDVDELRRQLQSLLPEYMVPSAFVTISHFPLTPNGKLDRNALPEPGRASLLSNVYEAPQGKIEMAMADIWKDVLQVEQIGRHDNFFQLGGHSLLVVQIIERMRRQNLFAEVKDIFTSPSIAALGKLIDEGRRTFIAPANQIPYGCNRIIPAMLPLVTLDQVAIDRIVASVPGGAANVQDIYPLTPLQEGILFHHLLKQEGDTYILPTLLKVKSRAQMESLLQALQIVIDRHDVLRTAIRWEGMTEPVQVVYQHAQLDVVDIVDPDPIGALHVLMEPHHMHMVLTEAPLLKAHRAQDESGVEYLLIWEHHLIGDHVSLEIILSEVQTLLSGVEKSALPTPIPFRNFVAQTRATHNHEAAETFFKRMLGDIDETTAPFGLFDVQIDATDIAETRQEIDRVLSRKIHAVARQYSVSAAVLFHLAWALVVARTSGRDDIVFGTVLSGRMGGGAGIDKTPGLFINTLPLRIRIAGLSVVELVRYTHQTLAELLQHEQTSLASAQKCSGVAGSAALFTSILNYRHNKAVVNDNDLSGIDILDALEWTNYPLTLSVDEGFDDFALTVQCDRSVAADRVLAFTQQALQELMRALDEQPDHPVELIDALPVEERNDVLYTFNQTEVNYAENLLVHQLFEAQAVRTPDAVAVIYEDQRLTYSQLNEKANQLAHRLAEKGVRPDTLVAVYLNRSLEMLIGLLGILKAGGAYLPLDPSHPADRLNYILDDANPEVVLTHSDLQDNINTWAVVIAMDIHCLDQETDLSLSSSKVPDGLSASSLCYVIYTSGSTGRPKGVMVEHGSVVNCLRAFQQQLHLHVTDSMLAVTTISFDIAALELYLPLTQGAQLILASREIAIDAYRLKDILEKFNITIMQATPATWRALLHTPWSGSENLTALCGGEALTQDLSNLLCKRVKCLWNVYGPTEATIWACSHLISKSIEATGRVEPIGKPVANVKIYILNKDLQPAPIGTAGDIYIGGIQVARGYLHRPELTSEKFVVDSFAHEAGARMYKTGDVGRWLPDGNIEYLGRDDFQVKIRGFRIELEEIQVCLHTHPAVKEAVVVVNEHSPEDQRLIAYVVAHDENGINFDGLKTHLKSSLPDYMIPSTFFKLDALPLTPNQKLDRKALPVVEGEGLTSTGYEMPHGDLEILIAEAFAEVLNRERIGRYDNFFDLGGHSLLALRLVERLKHHGIHLPLTALFTYSTVNRLALAVMKKMQGHHTEFLVPLRSTEAAKTLFLIHEVGGTLFGYATLVRLLNPQLSVYGLQAIYCDNYQDTSFSMEILANRYVGEIKKLQPGGPYRIAGWSFGGLMAHAIASQFIKNGEQVEFLGLIDAIRPADNTEIVSDLSMLSAYVRSLIKNITDESLQAIAESQDLEQAISLCKQENWLPKELSTEEVRIYIDIMRKHLQMAAQYQPESIDSNDVYLYSSDDEYSEIIRSWPSVIQGDLNIERIGGTHETIVTDPVYAEKLARAIEHACELRLS